MLDSVTSQQEAWIYTLSTTVDGDVRRSLLNRHGKAKTSELAQQLYDEALKLMRIDLDRAERVSEALLWATEDLDENATRGQALRMNAHILYLRGRYEAAVAVYEAAQATFEAIGDDVETARTISASLHALIYLGRSSQAQALAGKARKTFIECGDELRLARLDVNVGNLSYRQDRFAEALAMYERACPVLRSLGDAQDVAVVLRNMAVCQLSLGRFDQALEIYRDARRFTEERDLPLLLAEADYNIAYLYYLRGEYSRAVELYEAARVRCASVGDSYHRALCDLDQAEIYLEVNLVDEAAVLAADAFAGFQQLGMKYESAKALTFRSLAASRMGKWRNALGWLGSARRLFTQEKNRLWPALIDFYKSAILFEQGSSAEARRLCERAMRRFTGEKMNSKAAQCELLLARIAHSEMRLEDAKLGCTRAIGLLQDVIAPAVKFQSQLVLGQVLESAGEKQEALSAYTRAHLQLESIRSHVLNDDIKISFLKDKLSVYEGLVILCLANNDQARAFDFIECAKSRSLKDTIASRVHTLRPKVTVADELCERLEALGDTLASLRHQQRRYEYGGRETSAERFSRLAEQSLACEREYAEVASRIVAEDPQFAALLDASTVTLAEIQQTLEEGSLLLEYYEARGTIYACIVGRNQLRIVPVNTLAEVRDHLQLLQFQLAKFGLGEAYVRTFAEQLQTAADSHLRSLYEKLIAPVREELSASHLIIVPHGILHCVPFHALLDGDRYLIDDFSISYAPSASVHHLCSITGPSSAHDSLILGVPDSLAPDISDEASAVAAILPQARLFIGDKATGDCLRANVSSSRVVHIATHGRFLENPMFSSIRLSDTSISVFDLYQLRLDAELVTLSGCGTGLNAVVGGDELLGLVRGLMYAGARSVLATLWDVNDASTSAFMKTFYEFWAKVPDRGMAMRNALQELRKIYPHPYYWAPFALIGKHT